ncbi:hypothetical protein [Cloacibacillus porcorum]|uniref:hypothetical protein n=1 Tax=Cloacibacillus porcorum TaxID=1197717 RepID=UPI003CFBD53E
MKINFSEVYNAYVGMCEETESAWKMRTQLVGHKGTTYYYGNIPELDEQLRQKDKYESIYQGIEYVLKAPNLTYLMRAIRKFERKNNYEIVFNFKNNEHAIEQFLCQ